MCLKEPKKDIIKKEIEGEDIPFGPPTRYYNYQCSKCSYKNEVDEVIVDVNYYWTNKRTKTSDGESVPVVECPNCDNGKRTYICVD